MSNGFVHPHPADMRTCRHIHNCRYCKFPGTNQNPTCKACVQLPWDVRFLGLKWWQKVIEFFIQSGCEDCQFVPSNDDWERPWLMR